MDASPEDDQGKAKLFEEIKNRARYDSPPAIRVLFDCWCSRARDARGQTGGLSNPGPPRM